MSLCDNALLAEYLHGVARQDIFLCVPASYKPSSQLATSHLAILKLFDSNPLLSSFADEHQPWPTEDHKSISRFLWLQIHTLSWPSTFSFYMCRRKNTCLQLQRIHNRCYTLPSVSHALPCWWDILNSQESAFFCTADCFGDYYISSTCVGAVKRLKLPPNSIPPKLLSAWDIPFIHFACNFFSIACALNFLAQHNAVQSADAIQPNFN